MKYTIFLEPHKYNLTAKKNIDVTYKCNNVYTIVFHLKYYSIYILLFKNFLIFSHKICNQHIQAGI